MRKVKFTAFIAIILIVVGVIGALATFKPRQDNRNAYTYNETITANLVNDIVIATDDANVEVLPSDDQAINITAVGNNLNAEVWTSVQAGTLIIHFEHPRNKLFQFNLFPTLSSLKVYVPEHQFASLAVENNNGRTKVEEIEVKDVRIETANGLIDLRELTAEHVLVEASNGKIDLKNVQGEIYGETDNGAITMVTQDLNRNIELKTDIGMISVKTQIKPTNAEISAHVDIGTITIFGEANTNTIFGEGEHQIKLSTNIGKINVK